MLRAHAIRSDFDENIDDHVKGWILTSINGAVLGLSSSLSERLAKITAAQTAITWRCHVDNDWSYTGSNAHFAIRPMKALGIRRDPRDTNRAITLLCTIEDRRIGQPGPFERRACAMATVKEKLIVVAMSGPLPQSSSPPSPSPDTNGGPVGAGHMDPSTNDFGGAAPGPADAHSGAEGLHGGESMVEPGPDSLPDDLTRYLLAKAEGMAAHMRGELVHFRMPEPAA